jgi:hypothetical protein
MRLHRIPVRYLVVKPFSSGRLSRKRENARACQKQRAKNFRALTDSQSVSPPSRHIKTKKDAHTDNILSQTGYKFHHKKRQAQTPAFS